MIACFAFLAVGLFDLIFTYSAFERYGVLELTAYVAFLVIVLPIIFYTYSKRGSCIHDLFHGSYVDDENKHSRWVQVSFVATVLISVLYMITYKLWFVSSEGIDGALLQVVGLFSILCVGFIGWKVYKMGRMVVWYPLMMSLCIVLSIKAFTYAMIQFVSYRPGVYFPLSIIVGLTFYYILLWKSNQSYIGSKQRLMDNWSIYLSVPLVLLEGLYLNVNTVVSQVMNPERDVFNMLMSIVFYIAVLIFGIGDGSYCC